MLSGINCKDKIEHIGNLRVNRKFIWRFAQFSVLLKQRKEQKKAHNKWRHLCESHRVYKLAKYCGSYWNVKQEAHLYRLEIFSKTEKVLAAKCHKILPDMAKAN